MSATRLRLTISAKLIGLAAFAAATTASIFALHHYGYVSRFAEEKARERLAASVQLIAPYLRGAFDEMAQDLEVIQFAPPIQGVARAEANGGVDPFDGSTGELWLRRLEVIFASMLRARDGYAQVRYVRASDGMDLVRVGRVSDEIRALDLDTLQLDDAATGLDFAATLLPGEIAFSSVSADPDYGDVIRVVKPVHLSSGELYGHVVLYENYARLLDDVMRAIEPQWDVLVLDESNKIFAHRAADDSSELLSAESPRTLFHEAAQAVGASPSPRGEVQLDVANNHRLVRFEQVIVGREPHTHALRVALLADRDDLFSELSMLNLTNLLLSIGLVLGACAFGLILGRRFTIPLDQLGRALKDYGKHHSFDSLPIERPDEIGDFARAFREMATALQRSRRSEQAAHAQLRSTIENSIDAVLTFEEDGRICSVNSAAQTLFDYTAEELVGMDICALFPADMPRMDLLPDTGRHRFLGSVIETRGVTRDGTGVELELSLSEVGLPGEIMFCMIMRDVGERKRAERELETVLSQLEQMNSDLKAANSELETANDDIRSLAYIISHDLRAPLINVTGFSAELRRLLEALAALLEPIQAKSPEVANLIDARIPKALGFITDSTEKMADQLDAVLQLSRLGRYEMQPVSVDLHDLFVSVTKQHLNEEDRRAVHIDSGLPRLLIDKEAANVVARNLISNAAKYRHPERPLQIHIGAEQSRNGVTLCVADNGRGIAPEDQKDVFNLFRRVGRQDTQGEGIGLSFCKTLIARLRGKIWCQSAAGEGAKFFVYLPATTCPVDLEAA